MTLPFKKIDLSLSLDQVQQGPTEAVRYGIVVDGEFEGIRYNDCDISEDAMAKLYELIPAEYRMQFRPMYMHINRDIIPHTDSGVSTVINTYLQAGGYQTDFYKIKDGAEAFQIANQTKGQSYMFDDVEAEHSFIAEDGDTYVLDVTKLHGVHSGAQKDRYALAIGTQLPFDEVVDMLEKTID